MIEDQELLSGNLATDAHVWPGGAGVFWVEEIVGGDFLGFDGGSVKVQARRNASAAWTDLGNDLTRTTNGGGVVQSLPEGTSVRVLGVDISKVLVTLRPHKPMYT
jgi:hypothetical protein